MLLYCLAIEQTYGTWDRHFFVPMKHCLNLSSLYKISTLMHSPAHLTRRHLIFSKYCVYSRLWTHVWQKALLSTPSYLLMLTETLAWGVGGGPRMTGTAEAGWRGRAGMHTRGAHISLQSGAKPSNFCVSPFLSVKGWVKMCLLFWSVLETAVYY